MGPQMPLFLAGLLVRGGALSAQVVEEALQRQVLAGGALDSSLLELGAIEEPQLAEFLARASGLPLAPEEPLAVPDQKLRRLFPLRLAERHGLVPFAQEERTLRVACTYPADAALLEEMGFLLSQRIEAYVAPEFRIRVAIERLYGHAASARMHELARRCGMALAPAAAAPPAAPPPTVDPERVAPPDWSVGEALTRLEAATGRDEAIEVALRFCRRSFSWVALFGLVGGKAVGWDAIGETPGAERRVEQVVQPLDEDTVLATVVRTQGRYLGPIADTASNRRLLERMGRGLPQAAFVHPVDVGNRTVALVWADNAASPVAPVAAAEAMVVVQALGQALERLIRGRKAAVSLPEDGAEAPAGADAAHEPLPAPAADGSPSSSAPAAAPAEPPRHDGAPPASVAGESRAPLTAPAAASAAPRPETGSLASAAAPAPTVRLEAGPSPVVAQGAVRPEPGSPLPASAAFRREEGAAVAARVHHEALPTPSTAAAPAVARAPREAERPARPVASGSLLQACSGTEALLAAATDGERAEALARIAGSGAVGAELLVALLPGPLRTDASGAVCGGVVLDALAALGPWAVPALARAAGSPSSTVRYWVAVLLAGTDDPLAHAALARLASDADPHVAGIARVAARPA